MTLPLRAIVQRAIYAETDPGFNPFNKKVALMFPPVFAKEISDALNAKDGLVVSWNIEELTSHPDMKDQQWESTPVAINGISLPAVRIAAYITTVFIDEQGEKQEGYMVEDCSRSFHLELPSAVWRERLSIPAENQRDAEAKVIAILKRCMSQ